jgi:hypothetical protein
VDEFRWIVKLMGQGVRKQFRGFLDELSIEAVAQSHCLSKAVGALLLVLRKPGCRE